jgi:hypothetical protein
MYTILRCAGAACDASRLGAVLVPASLSDLHTGRGEDAVSAINPLSVGHAADI